MEKILLVRTDRIGDVISVTPAISILRKNLPDAHIALLVSPYTVDAVKNNPDIDEVIVQKPLFALLKELRKRKFDVCIAFFVDFRTALTAFLASIPMRIAPASKLWSLLFTDLIVQRRSKVPKHEADFNIDLLRPFISDITPAKPFIKVTDRQQRLARQYLKNKFSVTENDALICIHPGSKGSAKNWPAGHYSRLADIMSGEYPACKILLTGDASEQPLLNEISQASQIRPHILNESVTLEQLIGIISCAKLLISNSTGPLHIATAVGVPTVSFFPPLKGCLPSRWGPYGEGHIALMPKKEECNKCIREKCPLYDCMKLISPETALEAVKKQLGSNPA